jgi:hypothetical protein
MNLSPPDRRKLETMLGELLTVIEDFLRTGLTTASETTRQTLHVTFQEASRLRLLRLGSTIRMANDEMGKLIRNDADFSRSRFAFFLNRAWLLGRGLLKALRANDDAAFDRLLWTPPTRPVSKIEVVVIGVAKKVVPRTFVAFDFRLRLAAAAEGMEAGQAISWSSVFPLKPDQNTPAEAFLHLPHKQKFTANQFLEGKTILLEKIAISQEAAGAARLSLGDQSTVRTGSEVKDYDRYLTWDVAQALDRLARHEPGPFDLDVELQEEVVLRNWTVGEPQEREAEKQVWYPIVESGVVPLTGVISAQADASAQRKYLDEMRKQKKPSPLFGIMHYEKCRLMFQPLTLLGPKGVVHLTLSPDKIDRATLLKALKF